MATIFSRIVAGEIPSYKVAEDENYYAFLDINPLAKGHTLVIPKVEVDYLFDLEDETLTGLTVFAKKIAHKIKEQTGCVKVAMVVLGVQKIWQTQASMFWRYRAQLITTCFIPIRLWVMKLHVTTH